MRGLKWVAGLALAAMVLAGCGSSQSAASAGAGGELLDGHGTRDLHPSVNGADTSALVAGNTQFALNLFHQQPAGENLFFSPYSISLALAMTYAGARGDTATQMAQALGFALPAARLHPAFNALDLALEPPAASRAPQSFQLSIANALWGQRGYPFLDSFLSTLAVNYGAGLRAVDFSADPEASRQRINQWVSDQTAAKIQDLLGRGTVTSDTRLVLTNAIYFLAPWTEPFGEAATASGTFTPLTGASVTVPLMHRSSQCRYAAGTGWQAVSLDYVGGRQSMLVMVPDSGNFAAFDASLDAAKLASITGALHTAQVNLALPKFKLAAKLELNQNLADLGMTDAFNAARADFSGMDGRRDLVISGVVHKAYLSVYEAGTEAAAATAVGVGVTSVPGETHTLTVDRPFILAIRDEASGTVLFLGRVVNPSL